MVWDGLLGEWVADGILRPPRHDFGGKRRPRGAVSPTPILSRQSRRRSQPELLAEQQAADAAGTSFPRSLSSRSSSRLSYTSFPEGVEEQTAVIAAWARDSPEPNEDLVAKASRLPVESQTAPQGVRTYLPYSWRMYFTSTWGGYCQGVCGQRLSSVLRPGGGPQGAEFDHRDGNRSNGHISNWSMLCLTCHEAKTAIQAAEGVVPVPCPWAWMQHARYNDSTKTTEF